MKNPKKALLIILNIILLFLFIYSLENNLIIPYLFILLIIVIVRIYSIRKEIKELWENIFNILKVMNDGFRK